jgi:hypothetical protein
MAPTAIMPWDHSNRLTFVLVGISSFRLTLPGTFILSLLKIFDACSA